MPTFGSMVQKGKFAACALAFLQIALKSVDCRKQVAQVSIGDAGTSNMLLCGFAMSTALYPWFTFAVQGYIVVCEMLQGGIDTAQQQDRHD